jgi:hypothetical protein
VADEYKEWTWAQRTAIKLKMFAFFLAVGCPVGLILMATETQHEDASTSWPSVQGTVLNVYAKQYFEKNGPVRYYGRAQYGYTVDGHDYTSDQTNLSSGLKRSDETTALQDVIQYQRGTTVPVFYNPADPSEAILETGIPSNHLIVLVGLCVGFVVGVVGSFFVIRSWRRNRSERATQDGSE